MDATTYARVKAIYLDALDLTPRERSAHLDRCCGDDSNLRAAVEALLGNTDDRPLFDDAPPADDPLRISGAVIDGGYTVGRCVAEGGFSHVYRGTAADGRAVALKLLKPGLGLGDRAALREAFDREAGLLSRLGAAEAAVVEAHGLVEVETPRGQRLGCLVMAWLDGAVLAQVMRRAVRPWSLAEVLAVLGPVARTLALAHHEGIAHRDVKPDNIHIGRDGRLRILDLGVALSLSEDDPGVGSPGTPSYMAPELLAGEPAGPAHDLYAAGVTLYHLLTRKYPYGEVEPFQHPRFGEPVAPTRYRPDIPGWLENVLLKAVAREPALRFETAEEFLLALERGASRPVSRPPVTPLAMRNPLLTWRIIAGASLLLNLLLLMLLLR